MGLLHLSYEDKVLDDGKHIATSTSKLEKFNPLILWRNDSNPSSEEKMFEAFAAIFDLEGFTPFCNERDAHLEVLDYTTRFLQWLFGHLLMKFKKNELMELKKNEVNGTTLLWGYLPVFAKFTGDGVLFLWEIKKGDLYGGNPAIGNIVVRLQQTCLAYTAEFLEKLKQDFANPPKRLRCGGAFGRVVSIGQSQDFIGACINIAARLQKLATLSFVVARKGLDPAKCFHGEYQTRYVAKKISIRGGRHELVLVDRDEFKGLSSTEKKQFS